MNQNNEYIEISITELFKTTFKGIKIGVPFLVLSVILSFFFVKSLSGTYSAKIQFPNYINNGVKVSLVDKQTTFFVMKNIINNTPNSDLVSKIKINIKDNNKKNAKYSLSGYFIELKEKKDNRDIAKKIFNNFLKNVSNNNILKSKLSLKINSEQKNLNESLKYNNIQNNLYKKYLKNDLEFYKNKLSKNKDIGSLGGQTLLKQNQTSIKSYQNSIISIEKSSENISEKINNLKNKLDNKFTITGKLFYTPPKKMKIFVGSIFISLILSIILAFISGKIIELRSSRKKI